MVLVSYVISGGQLSATNEEELTAELSTMLPLRFYREASMIWV